MTKDQTSSSAQLAQALLLEQVRYFKSQLCAEHSSEYLQHLSHLIFQSPTAQTPSSHRYATT